MKNVLVLILLSAVIGCSSPTAPVKSDMAKVTVTMGSYHYVTVDVLPVNPGGELWIGSDTVLSYKKGTKIQVAWKELDATGIVWMTATGCLFTVTNDTTLLMW
jgi:hypothetical protein